MADGGRVLSSGRELDAAGILDPQLRADYARCRQLAAGRGRTYFLATRLLPPASRPAVHALYGFARIADEIVDDTAVTRSVEQRARQLDRLADELLRGRRSSEPACRAVADTAHLHKIDARLFQDFLISMRLDLTVTEYETYADLERYMHGSAAVIGLQMLPVLGTVGRIDDAAPYAARLGVAFQLTNFIRDVGEDLRRGRIYLPQESLRTFGVSRSRLERGVVDEPVRQLLRHEIERTRRMYAAAQPGVALLDPRSRPCVATAYTLYRDILAEVERADYEVLARRVSVPLSRRILVATAGLARALAARRTNAGPAGPTPTASG